MGPPSTVTPEWDHYLASFVLVPTRLKTVALTGQTSNPGAPLMRLLRLNRGDEAAVALAVGRPTTEVSGVIKQIQRRLTLEQQSEVVRRYQAGAQMSYLAKHFGVHRSTVSAILKRHGASTRDSQVCPRIRSTRRSCSTDGASHWPS